MRSIPTLAMVLVLIVLAAAVLSSCQTTTQICMNCWS
jgi:hypothetical protein